MGMPSEKKNSSVARAMGAVELMRDQPMSAWFAAADAALDAGAPDAALEAAAQDAALDATPDAAGDAGPGADPPRGRPQLPVGDRAGAR